MLFYHSDCDDCTVKTSTQKLNSLAFQSLPFLLTFLVVAIGVYIKLFPVLSGANGTSKEDYDDLPARSTASDKRRLLPSRTSLFPKRLAAVTFSTNIALSAVLVELLLCEISNALNPAARGLALQVTLASLLFLLVIATPALEIHSIISAAGYGLSNDKRGRRRFAWFLQLAILGLWLLCFWYLGKGLLGSYLHEKSYIRRHSFSEGCLERIGVIGISLMASLAGFAAVSSIWQSFGVRTRIISETDVARKQAGLDATNEMLEAKQNRLRVLHKKMMDTPQKGIMGRVFSSISGGTPESQERNSLQFEVTGLETMRRSVLNSLTALKSRRQEQQRSHSAFGRLLNLISYIFSFYCMYRLGATTLATARRFNSPKTTFSNSDPVNNILALLAKHWDPKLDRAAWSRQISFLLSGVMLLASFNSVLQTFLLFARLMPGVLHHAQANLALIVSQVAATYVISSAILLRSNLPSEVSSVISDALGAPLEAGFVERWFEGWFLFAAALTAAGIWISRKVKSSDWDDDGFDSLGDVELGKMS